MSRLRSASWFRSLQPLPAKRVKFANVSTLAIIDLHGSVLGVPFIYPADLSVSPAFAQTHSATSRCLRTGQLSVWKRRQPPSRGRKRAGVPFRSPCFTRWLLSIIHENG